MKLVKPALALLIVGSGVGAYVVANATTTPIFSFSTYMTVKPNNDSALSDADDNDNEIVDPEDDTPKIPADSTPWQAPNYTRQEGALGWSETAFAVPNGFQKRVDFWRDIYTKYSTQQGVLHDMIYIDIVYEAVDFRGIMRDPKTTARQKKKLREHLLKDRRKAIEDRLKRLAKVQSPDGLDGEDLRYWKLFARINDPARFSDAAEKGRVRFQLGQRDRFIQGIFYSGRYLKTMENIFREEGLPIELTRLPFVESSFNILARSRVGASGIWQFMRRTGKYYLKVNHNVDERNDPLRATRAAARMLRQNYQLLQSWPLAITGWNHGPSGVARIINKTGTRDLVQIVNTYSSRRFGFASENFYACFLAALEAEKNAWGYFGPVSWSQTLPSQEVVLTHATPYKALLALYDGDDDRARLLNPQLQPPVRKGRTPIPAGAYIRIPFERVGLVEELNKNKFTIDKFLALVKATPKNAVMSSPPVPAATASAAALVPANAPVGAVLASPPPVAVAPAGSMPTSTVGSHSSVTSAAVTAPPAAVAADKGVLNPAAAAPASGPSMMAAPSPSPAVVAEPTQSPPPVAVAPAGSPPTSAALTVPPAAALSHSSVTSAAASPPPAAVAASKDKKGGRKSKAADQPDAVPGVHKVKIGENLFRLAIKFNTTVDALKDKNPKLKKRAIQVGEEIQVPILEMASAQTANGAMSAGPVATDPAAKQPTDSATSQQGDKAAK